MKYKVNLFLVQIHFDIHEVFFTVAFSVNFEDLFMHKDFKIVCTQKESPFNSLFPSYFEVAWYIK